MFARLALPLCLLAVTPGPSLAQVPATAVATPALADTEVRKLLTRDEASKWDVALTRRKALAAEFEKATRRLAAGGAPAVEMKGFESESPEQRRQKAEKQVADAKAKLDQTDALLAGMREAALARLEKSTVRIPVPARDLRTEYAVAAAKFGVAAKEAGFTHLALAGVFSQVDGALIADAGLSDSLRAAFTATATKAQIAPAPTFKGDTLVVPAPGATGVVVAEIFPAPALGGLCSIVRLVDAKTFKIVASSVAIIPAKVSSGAAVRELTLRDKQNFFSRLGSGSRYSFGVEGDSLDAGLLRAVLAGHPEVATNDYAFLAKALGGKAPDAVSTAFWSVRSRADGTGFDWDTRAAGRPNVTPVGEVVWSTSASKN